MDRLIAIGEALIDFIPQQSGCELKNVQSFSPMPGGAPANVCAAFSKLGGDAAMLTQLGQDAFGDKIIDKLESVGVDTSLVARTSVANTSLAFVSLQEDGQRDFSFYRKPGADMLLSPDSVREDFFENAFALHYCSVSLGDFPMKEAHRRAIDLALKHNALISFDPNVRLPLWDSPEALKKAIWEFLPYTHILKLSDEELEFLTGQSSMDAAKPLLFQGNVALILLTKGADGAEAYTPTEAKVSFLNPALHN